MIRHKYADIERGINAVLAQQDDQIREIDFPEAGDAEDQIVRSEALLASLGYDPPKSDVAPQHTDKPLVIPTWENMLEGALP